MAIVVPLDEIRSSASVALFEGDKHGDGVPVSSFIVENDPGKGPVLHRHPYSEVFVVLDGLATFTSGDEQVDVAGGHVVVVPPNTPHKFVNSGEGKLRLVTIHTNGTLVQDDLE